MEQPERPGTVARLEAAGQFGDNPYRIHRLSAVGGSAGWPGRNP